VLVTPLDEDPAVLLDLLDGNLGRDAVHLPVPPHTRAWDQPPAALREPESRRDGWIDKGPEYSLGGLRIRIPTFTAGTCVSWSVWVEGVMRRRFPPLGQPNVGV
jgi:hypothetical protein